MCRTMVSGETVNHIHVLPQSLLVLFGGEGWPNLTPVVANAIQIVVTQEQVMWAHFTRYRQSLLLCSPYYLYFIFPGYVANVNGPVVQTGQQQYSSGGLSFGVYAQRIFLRPAVKVLTKKKRS